MARLPLFPLGTVLVPGAELPLQVIELYGTGHSWTCDWRTSCRQSPSSSSAGQARLSYVMTGFLTVLDKGIY